MSHPFDHPKAGELLDRVVLYFRRKTYIVRDSKIIFVCGGPMDEECMMRPKFCEYAKCELPNFRIFLAENAQKDYVNHIDPKFLNVAEFEDVISEISTCIVLFPESPGSYTELGYFANSKKIRKKLIVVNDAEFQSCDSFITLGPIELIDKHSDFRPTIQIFKAQNLSFQAVKERIEKRCSSKYRQLFKAQQYSDLSFLDKFFQVFEIMHIFQALTYNGIEYAFRRIWRNVKQKDLHQILSILVAADYVRRNSDPNDFFCINREISSFLEINISNRNNLKLEVVNLYDEYFPTIAKIVRELG